MQDDRKKIMKFSLTKMLIMGTLIVIVLYHPLLSWFTMNKEVEGTGVQMKTVGLNYEITSIVEEGSNGKWYDTYHEKLFNTGSNTLVWQITDESNFGNYQAENATAENGGIKPGSYGKISFNVTPRISPLDLKFDFEVIGYHSSDSVFNETPTKGKDNLLMTRVDTLDNGSEIVGYLNGHILLFEKRSPVYETKTTTDSETGEEKTEQVVVGYTYSGLIQTSDDMVRVLSNTEKTHFTTANSPTQVDIYWVWPNTLSSLIDVSSKGYTAPICTGTDLTAVQNYVLAHPEWFLKGCTAPSSDNAETGEESDANSTSLAPDDIIKDYENYGDMYDMADNSIGMNVNYILLRLSAEEISADTNDAGADPEIP